MQLQYLGHKQHCADLFNWNANEGSEKVQRNLKIAQIPILRGTYTCTYLINDQFVPVVWYQPLVHSKQQRWHRLQQVEEENYIVLMKYPGLHYYRRTEVSDMYTSHTGIGQQGPLFSSSCSCGQRHIVTTLL